MTRKDYQVLAAEINETVRICESAGDKYTKDFILDLVIRKLAAAFNEDDPRFDYVKFVAACRGKEN